MYQAIQRSTIWTVTNLMANNLTVHYSFMLTIVKYEESATQSSECFELQTFQFYSVGVFVFLGGGAH